MPGTQVLHGKLDILSSNGLNASPTSPPTPNAIKAFSPESDPVVRYMHQQMQQYVKQMKELAEEMQHALQHISDELATEIVREQQHLMLMQDQVMKSCLPFSSVKADVEQDLQAWTPAHARFASLCIAAAPCTASFRFSELRSTTLPSCMLDFSNSSTVQMHAQESLHGRFHLDQLHAGGQAQV